VTLTEIRAVLSEAHGQAAAIAQNHSDGDIRILAIAIAETARAAEALARLK
jgi:hypothetical protein